MWSPLNYGGGFPQEPTGLFIELAKSALAKAFFILQELFCTPRSEPATSQNPDGCLGNPAVLAQEPQSLYNPLVSSTTVSALFTCSQAEEL